MTDLDDLSILHECELTKDIPPLLEEEYVRASLDELIRETCESTRNYLGIKRNHVGSGISGSHMLQRARELLLSKK